MTRYDSILEAFRVYAARGVRPTTCRETWARLWNDIARAYVAGDLSDNEHDDLLSRYAAEVL